MPQSQDYPPQTNQPPRKDAPPVYNQDDEKNNPEVDSEGDEETPTKKTTEEGGRFGEQRNPEDTNI